MTKKNTTKSPAPPEADDKHALSYQWEEVSVPVQAPARPIDNAEALFLELLEKAVREGRFSAVWERRGVTFTIETVRLANGGYEFYLRG